MNWFDTLNDFGQLTAAIDANGERLTYKELAERADSSVVPLSGGRKLIAVECDNSIASLCAYLGALRARHPVVLIDPNSPPSFKEALFSRYGMDASWIAKNRSWEQLRSQAKPPALHEDLALLLSTSGTTGSPKLVRLSHRNIDANAASIASYLSLNVQSRPITALPMHYSYGLSVIHSHLAVGATLLLTSDSIASRSFWDFFKAESATSFSGVPAMYELLQRMRFANMDLPSLRTLTQAGGRLARESIKYFGSLAQSRGWRFFIMYGQTEASPRMAYVPPEYALEKADSIGHPIPGGSFRIVTATGETISQPGIEGELVYNGPNVMMGYAEKAEDLALSDMLKGMLMTGDMARFDDDGFFYVTGRIKRFLKIFGKRINLDEVESFAKARGIHAAATGSDDLLLLAVKEAQHPPLYIQREISTQFRLHHSAVRVIGVSDFPVSSAGKIQYSVLLSNLMEQQR